MCVSARMCTSVFPPLLLLTLTLTYVAARQMPGCHGDGFRVFWRRLMDLSFHATDKLRLPEHMIQVLLLMLLLLLLLLLMLLLMLTLLRCCYRCCCCCCCAGVLICVHIPCTGTFGWVYHITYRINKSEIIPRMGGIWTLRLSDTALTARCGGYDLGCGCDHV